MRNHFSIHAILRIFAVFAMVIATNSLADNKKVNTIVIFTDDHGWTDLDCQDIRDDLKTPNIDALAKSGVRMTSGYVTAPQCVPSRAGLLSGRSQNRFGVESNRDSLDGFNEQPTIAERLKKAGYATGMTGKWHLGPAPEITSHGFDDVYYKNANRPGWANYRLDGSDCEPGPEKSKLYHLDANSEAACTFIRRHHDEPFFFYCAYRAPHVPLDAPPKYLNRFPGAMPERRRQALAMISAIDDGVGRIVATLREHEVLDNTMIWLIGDNGAPLKIHKADLPGGGPGWDGSLNEPLNGEKGMLSEGGIRVPFVVSWTGGFEGGRTYDEPVISLDVAATAVELAGLKKDSILDGVNLVPFLRGDETGPPHETLFWRWIAQSAAREGKWKYLQGGNREYLFDLENDKEEKHNLIEKHPGIAKSLSAKLQGWSTELQPPGLSTGGMSEVWENYYDYYLDGKPAPPLRAKFQASSASKDTVIKDWVIRNATAQRTDVGYKITRIGKSNRPFIAAAKLDLPSRVQVQVEANALSKGQIGIQWRERDQKDFATKQVSKVDAVKNKLKRYSIPVIAQDRVIHVRLILPTDGAEIRSVQINDGEGKTLRQWNFSMRE